MDARGRLIGSAQTAISVAVSPKASGDLEMMGVYSYGDGSPVPSSVSGGGVSTWSDESFCGYATGASLSIWCGVVSSTGPSDITVSFATQAGSGVAFAQELSAGPSPTWSLDTSGFGTTKTTSAVPFPTLSPAGKGEAYFGLGFSYGQATAGSTLGYSYDIANQYGLGDGVLAFDPSVSSATAPTATESASAADAGAVLISASRVQGASYTYNQADQLTSAAVAGTGVVGYGYNGDGLLVASSNATGTATNTWDTTASVGLLLSDGTNDYIYGPDGTPVEQAGLASGTVDYYLSDAQGSTRALLSSSGAVAATFSYDAYGNLSSTSGAASTPLLYDGQYQDSTTGLYYLRARWYDPATSVFMSVDPMVSSTGQPFVYAGDNPVNSSDPSGTDPFLGIATTIACSLSMPGMEMTFSTARRSQCLFYQFVDHGYSEYAAAAVVGNTFVESSGIDSGGPLPNTTGDPMVAWQAIGAGCGLVSNLPPKEKAEQAALGCINVGIAQWGVPSSLYTSNPRVAGLVNYARQQGEPWWGFDVQVGYIFHELSTNALLANGKTGTDVAAELRSCGTSLYTCTQDFMLGYEGPASDSSIQLRVFYAGLALDAWRHIPTHGLNSCDLWAGWEHAAIVSRA